MKRLFYCLKSEVKLIKIILTVLFLSFLGCFFSLICSLIYSNFEAEVYTTKKWLSWVFLGAISGLLTAPVWLVLNVAGLPILLCKAKLKITKFIAIIFFLAPLAIRFDFILVAISEMQMISSTLYSEFNRLWHL
ncbi:MAG: hypothetical protein VKJ06_09350 [Vampirovibrionales bacterium]|nr:hypothetical protein [Vampirovibrionales bacterium]